jgi:hypothetical protein
VDGNLSSVAVDGGAASAGTGVASLPGVLAAPSTDVAGAKTSPTAANDKYSVPPAEIVAPKAPVQRKTCMVFEGKELSMEELRAQARKARSAS